jgi:hypothetical protein
LSFFARNQIRSTDGNDPSFRRFLDDLSCRFSEIRCGYYCGGRTLAMDALVPTQASRRSIHDEWFKLFAWTGEMTDSFDQPKTEWHQRKASSMMREGLWYLVWCILSVFRSCVLEYIVHLKRSQLRDDLDLRFKASGITFSGTLAGMTHWHRSTQGSREEDFCNRRRIATICGWKDRLMKS